MEPLLAAKENFVRQGALLALSFVMIQQNVPTCAKVGDFRETVMKMITEKGEDSITKVHWLKFSNISSRLQQDIFSLAL